jgi:hypothetical protein
VVCVEMQVVQASTCLIQRTRQRCANVTSELLSKSRRDCSWLMSGSRRLPMTRRRRPSSIHWQIGQTRVNTTFSTSPPRMSSQSPKVKTTCQQSMVWTKSFPTPRLQIQPPCLRPSTLSNANPLPHRKRRTVPHQTCAAPPPRTI